MKGKNTLKTSLLVGTALTLSQTNVNASNLFDFSILGTAPAVRNALSSASNAINLELKCGGKDTKNADQKCGEGKEKKCEGKCGGKKCKDKKKGKGKDHKCGEGKCGEATCGGKTTTEEQEKQPVATTTESTQSETPKN